MTSLEMGKGLGLARLSRWWRRSRGTWGKKVDQVSPGGLLENRQPVVSSVRGLLQLICSVPDLWRVFRAHSIPVGLEIRGHALGA